MTTSKYFFPEPCATVANEQLERPDWTSGVPRDPKKLWLDKNENIDPTLAAITCRVISSVDPSVIYSYPDCAPLYRKLGDYLGVQSKHLGLTVGSDGSIRAVFQSFINPGDVVLRTSPTFAMYAVYCQMFGARAVAQEYEPSPNGPHLASDTFIEKIRSVRPKLVCLPNPDSPTGTVYRSEELRRIIEAAGEAGGLILVDEAYYPFYEETALNWIDTYDHLVVVRTFSKAWGLAGLRLGYFAACPELVRLLQKVRPLYEIGAFDAAVIETMLDHADDVMESVRRLNEGRDTFSARMREVALRTFQSHGNFFHVNFDCYAARVHETLKDLAIYRRDLKEPCLAGFSRFTSAPLPLLEPIISTIVGVVGNSVAGKTMDAQRCERGT